MELGQGKGDAARRKAIMLRIDEINMETNVRDTNLFVKGRMAASGSAAATAAASATTAAAASTPATAATTAVAAAPSLVAEHQRNGGAQFPLHIPGSAGFSDGWVDGQEDYQEGCTSRRSPRRLQTQPR
jgi:hypothetical protein